MDKGAVMRTRFLTKYGGMIFIDVDEDEKSCLAISKTRMKYIRRDGWHLMAEPAEYDGTNIEVLEPIPITKDVAIIIIEETPQPEALNVRMVREGEDCVNSGGGDEDGEDEDGDEVSPHCLIWVLLYKIMNSN